MSTTSTRWIHRGVSALLGLVLVAAPVMSPAQAEPTNDGSDRAATEQAATDQADLPVVWNTGTLLFGGLARTLVPGWVPAGANDPTAS